MLDVANQEGPVECTIDSEENSQGQGGGSVFTIERDVFRRNCILRLADNVQLDYEKKTKYFLRVHVRHQRLKRQGGYDGYHNNGLVVFPFGLIEWCTPRSDYFLREDYSAQIRQFVI